MMQLTSSTSNYHLFTLLLVLLVLLQNHLIAANSFSSQSDHRQRLGFYHDLSSEDIDESQSPLRFHGDDFYAPDNEEIISRNPWSQLFRRHAQRSIYIPTHYSSPSSATHLRHGETHYVPYLAKKRSIPIEFQKALYAHGIVGRRR